MNVGVPEKIDQWRAWTSEIEDYAEETTPGIHKYLEKAKNEVEEALEADWEDDAWNQREMIWRFLKRYTTGEAKKVVTSASHRNGWEAWRKVKPSVRTRIGNARSRRYGELHQHGEPSGQNASRGQGFALRAR